MPFHRYWFHRSKQALRGFIERQKLISSSPDSTTTINDEFLRTWDGEWKTFTKKSSPNEKDDELEAERGDLVDFFKNYLINPNPIASKINAVSLSKNFVICNGCELSYRNFPNISLTNDDIFNLNNQRIASLDKDNLFIEDDGFAAGTALYHIQKSMSIDGSQSTKIKLPNLFALFEKSPRFIRGLSWRNPITKGDTVNVKIKFGNETEDYAPNETDDHVIEYGSVDMEVCKNPNDEKMKWKTIKNISRTNKPYFQTYDNLIQKEEHQHLMFTSTEGGNSLGEGKNSDGVFLGYQCTISTKGGNNPKRFKRNTPNHLGYDRLFSYQQIFHNTHNGSGVFKFCAAKDSWKNDDGWVDYCTRTIYNKGTYKTFTPIPNLGMFVFNRTIFNNTGGKSDCSLEGNFKKSFTTQENYFIDAENTKHYYNEIYDKDLEDKLSKAKDTIRSSS
jgi:hypothetical protein